MASIRKDNFLAPEVINSKLANPLQTRRKMTELNNDTWLSINNCDLIDYMQTKWSLTDIIYTCCLKVKQDWKNEKSKCLEQKCNQN